MAYITSTVFTAVRRIGGRGEGQRGRAWGLGGGGGEKGIQSLQTMPRIIGVPIPEASLDSGLVRRRACIGTRDLRLGRWGAIPPSLFPKGFGAERRDRTL